MTRPGFDAATAVIAMDTQVVLDDVNWTIQTLSGRGNTTIIYRKLSAILQELKNKIPAIKDFQAKRVFFFILHGSDRHGHEALWRHARYRLLRPLKF